MEDILLRVMVVVVGLLLPREDMVNWEHDGDVIMNMQEHKEMLQTERSRLEQEPHSVAMEPLRTRPEVFQNHPELLEEESEVSDFHKKPQTVESELPQAQHKLSKENWNQGALPTERSILESDVSEGAKMDQRLPKLPETVKDQNEIQVDFVKETSTTNQDVLPHDVDSSRVSREDPQMGQNPQEGHLKTSHQKETLVTEQESVGSGGVSQTDQAFLQQSQEGQQLKGNTGSNHKEQTQKTDTKHPMPEENTYWYWYIWNAYSLMSVIRLFKWFLGRRLKKETVKNKNIFAELSVPSKISLPDYMYLKRFYDCCIQSSSQERVCVFMEGFATDLLEALRNTTDKATDMHFEPFVPVGSLCELWATGKTLVCDMYVPLIPPKPYMFQCQLRNDKRNGVSLDPQGFSKIKVMKGGSSQNGCPCSSGTLEDDDFLCLLHPHDEKDNIVVDATDGPFCEDSTPYLAKGKVVKWFRAAVRKAWGEVSHKYDLELMFRHHDAPGALKVRFRSGEMILFNVTPVVKIKDTDVYLLSHLSSLKDDSPDNTWPMSFASYERALLQHFGKNLPEDSCHIHSLQILSFLHKKQIALSGKCGLTSYHLKNVLLHLLLAKEPTEWQPHNLTSRVHDMLSYLHHCLQVKELPHALVGNSLVPSEVEFPVEFRKAKPINAFYHLKLKQNLYIRTVKHFQEMVRNTPVLIHEYILLKCHVL
ncbi:inositol 1,4,5-trisphosphate receptor-interacting protein [Chanos chanos]|uniref:Inositol 1,4,5-trisphosphate receptor-interacting protein n=1 Tax=Chanos chanos TaxID=29144 RepID=A0A6J2VS57_CHACN|nr:inositol 1,4,5-trisphosphate receptor-interacting protein-like [Chanos chanos]